VKVTENGFNGITNLVLKVKKGDKVRITFVHEDPAGDVHPIQLSGYNRMASVEPGAQVVMEFTATDAGTFGFYCVNTDCSIHDKLQGGQLVVEG